MVDESGRLDEQDDEICEYTTRFFIFISVLNFSISSFAFVLAVITIKSAMLHFMGRVRRKYICSTNQILAQRLRVH